MYAVKGNKLIKIKKPQIVVDVSIQSKFTEQDLDTSKHLVVEDSYPQFYGEDLPESFKYVGRFIVDVDDIDWENKYENAQIARAGGGNPKHKEIKQDIREYGFKLKHPPIALRRLRNGKLVPLNGRTRKMILTELGVKNLIVDIYEKEEDYSWNQFEDDSSQFGLMANAEHDPAGNLTLEDVYHECILAIQKGWITKDITDINGRVNRMCGKGKFTKAKRDEITFRVYNHYRDSEEMSVLSWKSATSIRTWLDTKKYIGNDKVIYYPVSHSTPSKGITGAAKMAFDNPGKEIRVVVHTSILTAFDIERCYVNRVKDFVIEWENILQKISSGYFNGKVRTNSPIKLYGALPAVSTLHGLDKIVDFKSIAKQEQRLQKEAEEQYLYSEEFEEESEEEFA
jgi:hypothetical protein